MDRNQVVGRPLRVRDMGLVEEKRTVMDILELSLSKLSSKDINKYNT